MYPPSLPSREVMLGESLSPHIESNFDNVENNNTMSVTCQHFGANNTRQALFKKGGRKLRSTTSGLQCRHQSQQQHQKHPGPLRNNPMRLADINNNYVSKSPVQSNLEFPTSRSHSTVLTLHHFKQGTNKELLKSKTGRVERATQPSCPSVHSLKDDKAAQNLNTRKQKSKQINPPGSTPSAKKNDTGCHQRPALPHQVHHMEGKKPSCFAGNGTLLNVLPSELLADNDLKDAEKIEKFAGAKFSEPPSPSVLPKPPSHWVGEKSPHPSEPSREQMTVQLKSLLKVQAKP